MKLPLWKHTWLCKMHVAATKLIFIKSNYRQAGKSSTLISFDHRHFYSELKYHFHLLKGLSEINTLLNCHQLQLWTRHFMMQEGTYWLSASEAVHLSANNTTRCSTLEVNNNVHSYYILKNTSYWNVPTVYSLNS